MPTLQRPRLTVEEQREELPKTLLRLVDSNNELELRLKTLEGTDVDFSPLEAADAALEADVAALEARQIIAGAGLTGGGTLAADRTLNVVAADATLVVNADSVQLGVAQTANVADNAVSNAKLRDSGALSVVGRSANSSGDPADISATAASGAVLRESGSGLGFGTVATAGIADAAVTSAKLRNSAANSVIGRSTNTTGVPADIAAGTDGHYLRLSSSLVQFGAILDTHLPSTVVLGGGSGSTGRLAYWLNSGALTYSTRLSLAGTAIASGDFSLTGGFGTLRSVGSISGTDSRGTFTVFSSGTGQAANPLVTLTFKDGAFAAAPFAMVSRNGGNQLTVPISWSTTTTTLAIQFLGTPVAGEQYTFSFFVTG